MQPTGWIYCIDFRNLSLIFIGLHPEYWKSASKCWNRHSANKPIPRRTFNTNSKRTRTAYKVRNRIKSYKEKGSAVFNDVGKTQDRIRGKLVFLSCISYENTSRRSTNMCRIWLWLELFIYPRSILIRHPRIYHDLNPSYKTTYSERQLYISVYNYDTQAC